MATNLKKAKKTTKRILSRASKITAQARLMGERGNLSAADIKDVINQLRTLEYSKWILASKILKEFDIYQHSFNVPMDFVEYAVATTLLCHDNFLDPKKLFLRSVDIVITEKCSLKCKNCSNLMLCCRL